MPSLRKRLIVLVVAAGLLCLFLAIHIIGAENQEMERKCLSVTRTRRPIKIDSKLNDWPKRLKKAEMVLDPEEEKFRGTAQLVWDKKFLYVAFEVLSGKAMLNSGDDPSTAFKTGDTVEVFLSVNKNAPTDRTQPAEGDYRVLMTLLRNIKPVVFGYDFVNPGNKENSLYFKIGGPEARIDRSGIIPGAVLAVRETMIKGIAGYVAEAKLPWNYFRKYKPRSGDQLLFNLAINFSNDSGTANIAKKYWNGPSHITTDLGSEAQIHPENWGWIFLRRR